MAKNKGVQVFKFVRPEQLEDGTKLIEGEVPKPGQGEVLCRLTMRPVNPTDIHSIQGTRPIGPHDLPFVAGSEGVAVVEETGSGATKFSKGQRVVAVPWPLQEGQGSWQQYVTVPESVLVAVPDSIKDDKIAAQYLINPWTAYGLVDSAAVPKGDWLLQSGGDTQVGRMVISVAKRLGVRTINLIRRSAHRDELKQLGGDEVIVTTEEDVVKRVKEITGGRGAYAALDCVAGSLTAAIVSSLRNEGVVLMYGSLTQEPAQFDAVEMLYTLKRLEGWLCFPWAMGLGERRAQLEKDIWEWLATGELKPQLGEAYPLEKYVDAIRDSIKPGRPGKLFLQG